MPLKVRIDPVEKEISAILSRDLSRAEQQKAAGAFARQGIEEHKAANRLILGRVPPLTVWVDGRKGASLESVKPNGGTILGEFDLVEDVLRWIGEELVKRSPVVSGDYVEGHTLFADGTEVPPGGQIPVADEYVFTNLVPYARKIEIGKTQSGRAFVIQVPNRIYERTAKDARSRFGNISDIRFQHRTQVGAYRLRQSQGRRRGRQRGDEISSPAIVIRTLKA